MLKPRSQIGGGHGWSPFEFATRLPDTQLWTFCLAGLVKALVFCHPRARYLLDELRVLHIPKLSLPGMRDVSFCMRDLFMFFFFFKKSVWSLGVFTARWSQ